MSTKLKRRIEALQATERHGLPEVMYVVWVSPDGTRSEPEIAVDLRENKGNGTKQESSYRHWATPR